jgi:Arc/MetJ family transcription regulator
MASVTWACRSQLTASGTPGRRARTAQREAFRGFRVPRDGEEASRTAEELPQVEVGNAMRWLLQQHQALAADDLAREAARCFGITRLGSAVKEVMREAVERLVAAQRARREGDLIRGC